jgi:hypothetical protein
MEVGYFGGCPTCGANDGYLNCGRAHVFYGAEHKVAWDYGSNIFSSWRFESEAEQRAKYELIEDFELIERPLHPSDPGMTERKQDAVVPESPAAARLHAAMADSIKGFANEGGG